MSNCLLAKKTSHKKSKKLYKKGKKAYITWGDNDMKFPDDKEEANICLMKIH